ncbi:MAG: dihydropteroate synthase, partial [Bacteroidia bacterium]|nr:dihydropteroate synthase [Bacteroidia bacterium]
MLITQSEGKFLKRKNSISLGGELIDLTIPVVMGIINITPDSFYDGGKMTDEKVMLSAVENMITNGA